MVKQSYDALVDELAAIQSELTAAKHEVELHRREAGKWRRQATRYDQHLRMAEALNLSLFTAPDVGAMYQLLTEALVYQLKWDTAAVVSLHGTQPIIHAWQGLTQKQLSHLRDYLPQSAPFLARYHSGHPYATAHRTDKEDLSLRSLFHADEVLMAPIQFGDERYACIIVCANYDRPSLREDEELTVLAGVATLVAHAVQYNLSFSSLEVQNQRLRHLDELKDSFISITSHQLRTPLSIIKWVLAALRTDERIIGLGEQPLSLVEQAYATNERLIHEVNQLLNVSRIHEGRLSSTPHITDLARIARDIVDSASLLAEQRGVTVTLEIPVKLQEVNVDPILFKDAMQNLVHNAVDYCDEKSTINVRLEKMGDELLFSVTNVGTGILPADRGKVFNQFFRAQNAMLLQPNGNGLGLFLTRTIVEEHGGRITYVSDPGAETTFTIRLPLRNAGSPSAA